MSRIVRLREKKKMTQGEFCKAVGISRKTLYNYEKGRTKIPDDILIRLAKALGCSTDYLLGLTDFTTITVVKNEKPQEVICSIKGSEVIEHKDYKALFSVD